MNNNEGFTLIELIVVMAIIAVLVLLAAPSFLRNANDADVTSMKIDTKVLADASNLYQIKKGDWPTVEGVEPVEFGLGGISHVYPLDKNKLKDNVKNISGDYDEYGIVTTGKYKGKVFHIKGIEDKNGELHHQNGEFAAGIYTNEEIKHLINDGYIVVASSEDLEAIKSIETYTFGLGTEWEMTTIGGLDKKYVQVLDIDLSGVESYEPIGDYSTEDDSSVFSGTYDGGGFEISNLNINKGSVDYIALFGRTNEATIENVGLRNVEIIGGANVGALVGWNQNSVISNSYSTGNIEGQGKWKVGGLVGFNYTNSLISDSYTTANVKGSGNRVGGLVGENYMGSKVSNSYATGNVEGDEFYVGGLLGLNYGSSKVLNSYATGRVLSHDNYAGGLVGMNRDGSVIQNTYSTGGVTGQNRTGGLVGKSFNSSIINSYTTSSVNSPGTDIGAVGSLVGRFYNNNGHKSVIKNSYAQIHSLPFAGLTDWNINSGYPENNTLIESKKLSTTDMKKKSSYAGWDFDKDWMIISGQYPTLRLEN